MGSLILAALLSVATLDVDDRLTTMAEAICAQAHLDLRPAVVIHELWREQGIVNAESMPALDGRWGILVSPLLAEDLYGDGERGMLAHELAHAVVPCSPDLPFEEDVRCQMRADAESVRYVGKRAVLMGLCQMMFSAWNRRARTDVSDLLARIRRVHELPEGPHH